MIIGTGDLWENSTHRKIPESLLGSAGVRSCPGLSNWCTFGFSNQQTGRYAPATELELIMFQPFPSGEIVCHIITKVNNGIIAAYITVFDLMRGNRRYFILFIVYSLVYPSIASNLVKLATLSPWYDSVHTHT